MNRDQFSEILENMKSDSGLDLTTPRTTLHGRHIALDNAILFPQVRVSSDTPRRGAMFANLLDERPINTELTVLHNGTVKLGTYATGATNNKGEGQHNVAFTMEEWPKTKTNNVSERGIITYPRSTEDVDDHFKRISDAVAKFSPTQFKEMTNWRDHVNQANSERIPNYRRGTIRVSLSGKNFVFDPKTQDFFEGQEEY